VHDNVIVTHLASLKSFTSFTCIRCSGDWPSHRSALYAPQPLKQARVDVVLCVTHLMLVINMYTTMRCSSTSSLTV
jgi:hypothetical protein